ncbi:AraC family transcriptional regulator [Methylobacterium sp. Leaf89]|uniref:helix-turn-helix domain-containing protein n=2 Tax=Methylobacterium TaxID=407 RepID=UPI0009EA866C|nr:AraC family transcriptional regulator [Methylobacterium sp. Leaf89]
MIEYLFQSIADNNTRRRAWIDALADLFEVRCEQDVFVPCSVYQRYYNLKKMMFTETDGFKQVAERKLSQIANQNIDHICISLQLSGRKKIATGRCVSEIEKEMLVVFDLSQELSIDRAGGGAELGAIVPRRVLDGWRGDPSSWHGRVIPPTTTPLTLLLADHLKGLRTCLRTAAPLQKNRLAEASIALCNAAFIAEADSAYNHTGVLGIAVRQEIDRNLAAIDAETLMAKFGLSRTPLYKLFEADGGVYAYIRSRRLAHAMQQLACAAGGRRPRIAQLAFESGFENEQVFSRAFRRKYGLNPSEVDATCQVCPHDDRASRLLSWLREL